MTDQCDNQAFAKLLRNFFTRHLMVEKGVSPRTVEAYRDAFRLLFDYMQRVLRKKPVDIALKDLDVDLLLGFLDSLEKDRGNSIRTRNARLAALKSFLRYAAAREVTQLPVLQQSLAIPTKRYDRPLLGFLSREEIEALLAAPDRRTWSGERDFALFSAAYNTGARVSELLALTVANAELGQSGWLHITGKGRKSRLVPLWKNTRKILQQWVRRLPEGDTCSLFPNRKGNRMSRSGMEKRLRAAVKTATENCPSLFGRRISPHILRHTTAMHLLQSGVDLATIALWLGHSNPATTHGYVEADLAMKERALQKLPEPASGHKRYQPSDSLLAFLDGL